MPNIVVKILSAVIGALLMIGFLLLLNNDKNDIVEETKKSGVLECNQSELERIAESRKKEIERLKKQSEDLIQSLEESNKNQEELQKFLDDLQRDLDNDKTLIDGDISPRTLEFLRKLNEETARMPND